MNPVKNAPVSAAETVGILKMCTVRDLVQWLNVYASTKGTKTHWE